MYLAGKSVISSLHGFDRRFVQGRRSLNSELYVFLFKRENQLLIRLLYLVCLRVKFSDSLRYIRSRLDEWMFRFCAMGQFT